MSRSWMNKGKPLTDKELKDTFDHVEAGYAVNALEFVPRVKATIEARDAEIEDLRHAADHALDCKETHLCGDCARLLRMAVPR